MFIVVFETESRSQYYSITTSGVLSRCWYRFTILLLGLEIDLTLGFLLLLGLVLRCVIQRGTLIVWVASGWRHSKFQNTKLITTTSATSDDDVLKLSYELAPMEDKTHCIICSGLYIVPFQNSY